MRRVLVYAAIYGGIGALVGVCVALYTKDVDAMVPKRFTVLQNGSAAKVPKTHSSTSTGGTEAAESVTPTQQARED